MPFFINRFLSKVRDSLAARVHHWNLYSQREQELNHLALTSHLSGVTSEPIAEEQVIVNVTTHGRRIYDVHLSIEALMQGSVLPNRIILWLSESFRHQRLPQVLQNQCARGLEIHYTEDIGPYTKLVPAFQCFPNAIHVTIDDDILYPYDTLELLLSAHYMHPQDICANRILEMSYNANHQLMTLSSWHELTDPLRVTNHNFFEGVGGVLYPPHSLHAAVMDHSLFSVLAPTADDVWFNAMAHLNQTIIRSANLHYQTFPLLINERVQDMALWRQNNSGQHSQNDKQLEAVWRHFSIKIEP